VFVVDDDHFSSECCLDSEYSQNDLTVSWRRLVR
jgi:hypothetical protein